MPFQDIRLNITAKDKTQRAFKSIDNSLRSTTRSVMSATTSISALVGAGSMALLIKRTIDSGDEIGTLNKRIGASTEALGQYRLVADRANISFNTLTLGWQRMTRRISEAANGTGEAKDALRELNLSAVELNRLKPEDQFERLADALMQVEEPADRVRLAMKLFDSEGVSLIQTMTNGAAGIRELREEADAMGLTLTQQQTEAFAAFNNQLKDIKNSATGLAQTLTLSFGDTLVDVVDYINNQVVPAFKFWADQLGLLDANITNLTLDEIEARIGALIEEAGDLKREMEIKVRDHVDTSGVLAEIYEVSAAIDELRQQKQKLLNPGGENESDLGGGEARNFINGLTTEEMDEHLAQILWYNERSREIDELQAKQKKELASDVAKHELETRQDVVGGTISLMRILGRENKNWAMAALAVEKGLAIAETIINTHAASMAAMKLDPSGARSAAIEAMGNIKVGLIAATGLAQAHQMNTSGGAQGAPTNPLTTSPVSGFESGLDAVDRVQRTVTININGPSDRQYVRDTIEPILRDDINNNDVLIFDQGSRQFDQILDAATI